MKKMKYMGLILLIALFSCDSEKLGNVEAPASDTTAPDAPTSLKTKSYDKKIVVSWTAPSASDVQYYEVELKIGNGAFQVFNATHLTATSRTLNGLTNDVEHSIRIRAVDNSNNKGSFSSAVTATPSTGQNAYGNLWTELNAVSGSNYSTVITNINNLLNSTTVIVNDSIKDSLRYAVGVAYYLNGDYKNAVTNLKAGSNKAGKAVLALAASLGEDHASAVEALKSIMTRQDRVINGGSNEFYILQSHTSRSSKINTDISSKNLLLSGALSALMSNNLKWAAHFLDSYEPGKWHSKTSFDQLFADLKRLSQGNKTSNHILDHILAKL